MEIIYHISLYSFFILSQLVFILVWINTIMKPKNKIAVNIFYICFYIANLILKAYTYNYQFIFSIIAIAVVFFMFNESTFKKYLKFFLYTFLNMACEIFTVGFLYLFLNDNVMNYSKIVYTDFNSPYWSIFVLIGVVENILVLFVTLVCYLFYKRKSFLIDNKSLIKFFIAPTIEIILLIVLGEYAFTNKLTFQVYFYVFFAALTIVSTFHTLKLLKEITEKNQKIEQSKYIESQIKTQYDYHQILCEQIQQTQKMRHDIANYIQAIDNISEKSNNDQIIKYSNQIKDDYFNMYSFKPTNNLIVDTIIYNKMNFASKNGCKIKSNFMVNNYGDIQDKDLVSIISNLLDNAIENCKSQSEIIFEMKTISGYLIIKTSNKINETENNIKKDTSYEHGLGTIIINDICKRYNGKYYVEKNNDEYKANVTMQLQRSV